MNGTVGAVAIYVCGTVTITVSGTFVGTKVAGIITIDG